MGYIISLYLVLILGMGSYETQKHKFGHPCYMLC